MVKTPSDRKDRITWANILLNTRGVGGTVAKARFDGFVAGRTWISKLHFREDQLGGHGAPRKGELPAAKPRLAPPQAPLLRTVQVAVDAGLLPQPSPSHPESPRSAQQTELRKLTAYVQLGKVAISTLEKKLSAGVVEAVGEIAEVQSLLEVSEMFRELLPDPSVGPGKAPASNSLGDRGQVDWFMGMLQESDTLCRYYTGEISFKNLVGIFEWIDCCGAFSELRVGSQDRTSTGGQKTKSKAGRPAVLTPLEQFVFWISAFRRFKDDMVHACNLFGIGQTTGRTYYELYSNAIHWFSKYMMPEPTHEQYVKDTSAETRGLLGLEADQGVVIGDCTERFIHNTSSDALHAAFFSQYKDSTTLKLKVHTTGGSYIAPGITPYCGGCSDNAIHTLLQVAKRLPRLPSGDTRLVYNYDRGLTDTLSFMEVGVPVHSSDKKQTNQKVFSKDSADRSRNTAVSRIHVERNMKELREYRGFSSKIKLVQVSLAVCEAECARFLVNLKPNLHNWVQVSLSAEGGGSAIPIPRTSGEEDTSCFF
jgi:hypothetical protein